MSAYIRRALLSCVVIMLAACTSTSAPEHRSEKDPKADIGAWSTFGWKAPSAAEADEPARMLDVNIRNAIVAELTKRGYREDTASPQFLVTYETAAQDKVKSSPFSVGIGMGSFGGNVGGSVGVSSPTVRSYREGRLGIHVIDAAANQEVWFGTVEGRVDNQSLDAATVARVVALAMESLPARTAGP